MLEKAPDELEGIDGGAARPVALFFAVGEGDLPVFGIDDPGVGDGHPEDVYGARYLRVASLSPTACELTFQSIFQTAGSMVPMSFCRLISVRNLARKMLERALTGR